MITTGLAVLGLLTMFLFLAALCECGTGERAHDRRRENIIIGMLLTSAIFILGGLLL